MTDFNVVPTIPAKPATIARRDPGAQPLATSSRLLPKHLRPHVLAFHRFLRLGNDIADDAEMEPETKLAYLDALERALTSGQAKHAYLKPAVDLRQSLQATGVQDRHARQVLRAFRRNAVGARCHTWSDLLLYCRFAANPVGRYLLELHGEGAGAGPAADALCSAVQILKHLQSGRDDWVVLGRCHLPLTWFDEAGISVERMVESETDPKLRGLFDKLLDHTDRLLERAATLPGQIAHRGLRIETSVLLAQTEALSRRLRSRDPMAGRVALGAHQRVAATMRGVARGFATR